MASSGVWALVEPDSDASSDNSGWGHGGGCLDASGVTDGPGHPSIIALAVNPALSDGKQHAVWGLREPDEDASGDAGAADAAHGPDRPHVAPLAANPGPSQDEQNAVWRIVEPDDDVSSDPGGGNAAHAVWAGVSASQPGARLSLGKRGRGRPRGTLGSSAVRQRLREQRRQGGQEARDTQGPELPLALHPGCMQPADGGLGGLRQLLRPLGGPVLHAVVAAVQRLQVREMSTVDKLVEYCLGPQARGALPLQQEARTLERHRNVLKDHIVDLAAAVHFGCRAFVASVLADVGNCIRSGTLAPIAAMTYASFDETPMPFRADAFTKGAPVSLWHLGGEGADAMPADGASVCGTQTCKVFQCEATLGLLLRVVRGGRYVMLALPLTCPLQLADSSCAEIVMAILEEQLHVPMWESVRQDFPVCLALSNCDAAASNLRAESGAARRYPTVQRLQVLCDAHMLSRAQGWAYGTVSTCVSGIIAVALSMRAGDAVAKLRAEVAAVLVANVKVYPSRGPDPDDEHIQHRDALLDLLLPATPAGEKRRRVLQELLTGDIRHPFIAWHTLESAPSVDVWATRVAAALVPTGGGVRMFPRHRWMNSLQSVSDCALLANVHGVLLQAIPRWCAVLRGKPGHASVWALDDDEAAEPGNGDEATGEPTGGDVWQLFLEKQRGDAARFAKSDPAGTLLIIRLALQPQVRLFCSIQDFASADWYAQALSAAAQDADGMLLSRMSTGYSGNEVARCLLRIRELMRTPTCWQLLPLGLRTQARAMEAFAMLSRAACAVFQLMSLPKQGYPWKLWTLPYGGRSDAEQVLGESLSSCG